jgi:hypothetical protein
MYMICIIVQIHQLFNRSKKCTFAYICGRKKYYSCEDYKLIMLRITKTNNKDNMPDLQALIHELQIPFNQWTIGCP